MATSRRKRRGRSIPLPWERRSAFLRELITGSRWKAALVVIGVVWAGIAIFRAAQHDSDVRETRAAILKMHQAIDAFRAEVGRCPTGPEELLHPPRDAERRLRELPLDAWRRPLFIQCPAPGAPELAEVISAGPSGDLFVDDNVR